MKLKRIEVDADWCLLSKRVLRHSGVEALKLVGCFRGVVHCIPSRSGGGKV